MKNFDLFGVMIDCSRNAVPNIDGLKRFLKIISEMGYNCAMLYTEDTYEVKGEPYFGYKRGRYSMAELHELDDYAFSIGVELIPCIQTLAHLNAAFRWQEYRQIQDCDDILLLDEERTKELLLHMFETTSECFRSRRIHIGMDEAHRIGLGRYLDKHGFTDRYELLLRHLHDVCQMAKQFGYEPIMWEDMFFRLAHGAYFSDHVVDFSEEVKKKRNFLIFPEGTRSKNGNKILDFKGGTFKSAVNARCPIVPVALVNSFKPFDISSIKKETVQVHFLEPIPYEQYMGMKTTEIAHLVHDKIQGKIDEFI